ncbi:unnamed protein product [Leptidea sinapis]|uniref:Uncharacterized protein n=1 Tax=Leptidea sinapis TaxID=189913 RepID=A0A5E4PR29_9NEOP|nr:unnamed protein product [Leptidea sinapis]
MHAVSFASSLLTSTPALAAPNTIEYNDGDMLASIPEREWKLLAALARKREEEDQRRNLADQFQKMWLKENEERQKLKVDASEQYRRYIHKKRDQDRNSQQYRMLQLAAEDQARREQFLDCIRHKEKKSADLKA